LDVYLSGLTGLLLMMTFLVCTLVPGESVDAISGDSSPETFVLLAGLTCLCTKATDNGSAEWADDGAARQVVESRRVLAPVII
jgi:hypothetical protein